MLFRSDGSDTLSQPGGAVLQDLGIVPQTIIFSIRSADDITNINRDLQARLISDNYPKRFSTDSPRSPASVAFSRSGGTHRHSSGAQAGEDLRRRLALVGGSNTSLASQVGDNVSVTHGGTDLAPSPLSDISDLERAASQSSTDDLSDATGASRTDIVQPKSRSRVHLNGVEVGRVAPAIGQDSTNVMGLFNVEARYRGDEDVMSAISTAVSVSPFARPVSRGLQAHATQRFVSTYGSFALRTSQEDADSSFSQRATIPEIGRAHV